jgi:hypothetical protein
MKFEFTIEEINTVMAALGRMPYEQVFQLVEKIRQQAAPQLQEAQAAQAAEQSE